MTTRDMKTLGEDGARLLTSLSVAGKTVFTSEDAAQVLGDKVNARLLLSRLEKKRWLKRLEKGKYLILPFEAGMEGKYSEHPFIIASKLITPYAVSYWSALNHYGYTEQIPGTIYVSSTKRRTDMEIADLGLRFKFVRLTPSKFFGHHAVWIQERKINITDREKTIVDCLDHPEYCGGIVEATKGLWYGCTQEEIDVAKLTEYVERMNNRSIFKRLGYLAELLKLPVGEFLQTWKRNISSGYSLLDPVMPKAGRHNSRWNLRINVTHHDLTEWRTH